MSKVISAVIIVLFCFVGWSVYKYWTKIDGESELSQSEADRLHTPAGFEPRTLSGMPQGARDTLENSLAKAQSTGVAGMRDWLKACRPMVQDPRLAWIELDYVVMLARDNPAEAKKLFAEVKERTPPSSPVYARIKQLEKTYE